MHSHPGEIERTELKKTKEALKKSEKALKEAKVALKSLSSDLERIVKERAEKLLENEQDYRELYESISEALIATDWDLSIIYWNKVAERITNVKAEDALGKKVYDVLPEMTKIDIAPHLESLQKNQPAHFMMNTINRATGHEATFEISVYPFKMGITIIVKDKTEEESTKRLTTIGQTAGMVGHDIRNPLQAIVSDVYLLRSDLAKMPESSTKEGVMESLDSIEKNVSYIDKIVQDLQDYAKPIQPNLTQVDIKGIFQDVLVKKAIPDNIQSNCQIDSDVSKIKADPILLKRILANLVNNAVQAMPSGGRLDLSAHKDMGFVRITVQDSGIGIPEEIKPIIFTPLFTTKAKGQGFGLAAVKRLTDALGGTVSFESQEKKGTKFIVSLPTEKTT